MAQITMSQMLNAGVHFGHQTSRWNPKMKQYILMERNGIHIIDLFKSMDLIDQAYTFIKDTVAHNGTVLLSGPRSRPRRLSPPRRPAWACLTSPNAGSVAC